MSSDKIQQHQVYQLRVLIITLKDRQDCVKADYVDKYGPIVQELISDFFAEKQWLGQIENVVLVNDADLLKAKLQEAINNNIDVIFTIGGTGVGREDITPEVVEAVCEKIIPGIMDNIRLKYGAQKPAALISRSTAGVAKQTQIYTLPATTRAIKEYCQEIFQTLEHIKKHIEIYP